MIRLVASALMAALLATSAASAQPVPIEIDVVLPATGAIAFLGRAEQQAFTIAESTINASGGIRGRPIKFVFSDDASNPQIAVQVVNGIVAKHVSVFLGSPFAASCQAFLPLVARTGPLNYCLAPIIHPPSGSFVFSAGASSFDDAVVILRYLRERGLTRVGIITSTDATGQDMDAAFAQSFALPVNKVFQIVGSEHVNPSDVTVTAQLARLKSGNPQAVITWAIGPPMGTILRGIREIGLDVVPITAANGNQIYQQLAQYTSIAPKELLFPGYRAMTEGEVRPGPIRDAQTVFFRAFKAASVRPDIAHVTSWDAIMIVIDTLRHLGANATPAQMRDYIENLHGFAGINAVYDFRDGGQRGVGTNALVMHRWDPATNSFTAVSKVAGALR